MATSNRNGRVLFRYGICLNDQCSKCKSKEVQEIGARKEFVCTECGKQLRECPRPKSWWEKYGKKVMIGGVAAVLIGGLIGLLPHLGGDSKPIDVGKKDTITPPPVQETIRIDTVHVNSKLDVVYHILEPKGDTIKVDSIKIKSAPGPGPTGPSGETHGTVQLSYGTYTGDLFNGKPHGYGTMKYTKERTIIPSKNIKAYSGDTFEGDFRNGEISGPGYLTHNGESKHVKP